MNKEFGDWRDENSGVVHHRLDGFVEELGDDLSNVEEGKTINKDSRE